MNEDNFYSDNSYGLLKCIWMASNVIEYKLCDKKFDCENCRFDKVMRNYGENEMQTNNILSAVNLVERRLKSIKYDEKFIYLKHCFIIKQVLPNTYYLGVNPLFISFLDHVGIIMDFSQSRSILSGQPVVQFFGEWGTSSLTAPMNFSIYDKVNNPADDLAKSKWIAIIGAIEQEVSAGRIEHSEWQVLQKKSFGIVEEIKSNYPEVGLTMLDGGDQVKYLHQLVGREKYVGILQALIS